MKLLGSGADLAHGRAFLMWEDEGYQFRANILLYPGATIPMHSHEYAHDYELGKGVYGLTVESPEGVVEPEVVLPAGAKGSVPARWKHHFRLIEWGGEPGHVKCFWRDGVQRG